MLLNLFLSASSSMFASSSWPISSGFNAATLPAVPGDVVTRFVLQPSSVHLKFLPNISISRTSRFPLPRMTRTFRVTFSTSKDDTHLHVVPFAHPRSHFPQLRLRGCELEVVATHNDPHHLFSLAYFPNFLNLFRNSTHYSSSHFALRSAFFTSMDMNLTSTWRCLQ